MVEVVEIRGGSDGGGGGSGGGHDGSDGGGDGSGTRGGGGGGDGAADLGVSLRIPPSCPTALSEAPLGWARGRRLSELGKPSKLSLWSHL